MIKLKIELEPIGVIHSPHKTKKRTPIQPHFSDAIGEVEVFDNFKVGLKDVEGFSHLILVYFFHKSDKTILQSAPFLDKDVKGVFAIRHPDRPNHIGVSIVKLLEINENILKVKGIDTLDGTPLLDIKPYVPEFDHGDNIKIGWLSDKL